MALVHDFWLVDHTTYQELGFTMLFHLEQEERRFHVPIHDDFFRYIQDSLRWVTTFDPIKEQKIEGFNYHGVSVIEKECADKFIKILTGWVHLLREAPEVIRLTGTYQWIAGESVESGSYEKLEFKKFELLAELERLIAFGEQVKSGDKLILYGGI